MSSIAQTCLHLTSVPKQLEILWGPDNGQDCINSDLIPLWFDEILENGYPDDDILVELETTMETNLSLSCDIPEQHSDALAQCVTTYSL